MLYQWLNENYQLLKDFGLSNPIEFDLLQYIYTSNYLNKELEVEHIFPKFTLYSNELLQESLLNLAFCNLITSAKDNSNSFLPTQKAHDLFALLDKAYSQFSSV